MLSIFWISILGNKAVQFPGIWINDRWEILHPLEHGLEPVFLMGKSLGLVDPVTKVPVAAQVLRREVVDL